MSEVINQATSGQEPFKTTNRQLAFALASAGCQWRPAHEGGPTENLYTLGFIRSQKVPDPITGKDMLKGKNIEQAVDILLAKKIPGIVTYYFVRDETFDRAIKGWDETTAEMQKADEEKRDPYFPDIDPETIARVICVHVNNANRLAPFLPFVNRPLCSDVSGEAHEQEIAGKPAGRTTITGKGRIWTHRCSQEIKKKLDLNF